MTKTIQFFFVILSSMCFSQNFNTGIVVGITTSQVSGDNLSGFDKSGLRIGGFINQKIENINAQLELQYINQGSRDAITPNTYEEGYSFQLNYIQIPVSMKKNIYKSNNIEFGFAIGYLLNWSEKYNGVDEYGANVNKLEYSIHIGGEYKIYNNLYFNTRISNSIFPIRPHISGETYKWNKGQYNTSISFAINYHILKDSRLRTR